MKTTVVDLRYRMKEVLKALDRREAVTILYHGKVKGVILPAGSKTAIRVEQHPFFRMGAEQAEPVGQMMERLRGSRFDAL